VANRAFKYFTIQSGGTPQPVVGTYLTAAVTANAAAHAMRWDQNINNPVILTVADSSMFVRSDYVNVVDPSTYVTERGMVAEVTDSTHIKVTGILKAHPGGAYGTGAWVALGAFAQSLYIQGKPGNTGLLYIGTTPQMVTATGVGTIVLIGFTVSGVQPYEFSTSRQGLANEETLSQYWIDGTTGDGYLPSIGVI
jgi:hypothetical protein